MSSSSPSPSPSLSTSSSSPIDHGKRAQELLASGNLEGAAFHLQLQLRQLRKGPQKTRGGGAAVRHALRQLGDVYYLSGRHVRAAEAYGQLVQLEGPGVSAVDVMYRLGASLLLCGKRGASQHLAAAKAKLEAAKEEHTRHYAAVLCALGRAHFRERSNAAAVAALEEGLTLLHLVDPDAAATEEVAALQMARDAMMEEQKKEEGRRKTFNNNPDSLSLARLAANENVYSIN